MHKIFMALRAFLAGQSRPPVDADPLGRMSPRELADLPAHHPRSETCTG